MLNKNKTFIVVISTAFIFYISTIINYMIFGIYHNNNIIEVALKPIPLLILICQTISYMYIYGRHSYSLLLFIGLIFCMFGDIAVSLVYINENIIWLCGIPLFFFGRLFFIIMYFKWPYNSQPVIESLKIRHGVYIIISIPIFIASLYFYMIPTIQYTKINFVKIILTSLYLYIGIFTIVSSMIRLDLYNWESKISRILGFSGAVIFAISDVMLGYTLYYKDFKNSQYFILSTYWLGIYLIALSVVRVWTNRNIEYDGIINSEYVGYIL